MFEGKPRTGLELTVLCFISKVARSRSMAEGEATPPETPENATPIQSRSASVSPKNKSKQDGAGGSKVKVFVRVRPLLHLEIMRNASFTLKHSVERRQISMGNGKGSHEYTYDGVLPDDYTQVNIYINLHTFTWHHDNRVFVELFFTAG